MQLACTIISKRTYRGFCIGVNKVRLQKKKNPDLFLLYQEISSFLSFIQTHIHTYIDHSYSYSCVVRMFALEPFKQGLSPTA